MTFTSDEFAVPQVALRAATASVVPIAEAVGPATAPGADAPASVVGRSRPEDDARRDGELDWGLRPPAELVDVEHFIIDPESTWLEFHGVPVAPLPVSYWDTRWQDFFPIRTVDFGSSSEFGVFGGVDWNVNYFLRLLPAERFLPLNIVESNARLGFETIYMERTRAGLGTQRRVWHRPARLGALVAPTRELELLRRGAVLLGVRRGR